MAIIIIIHDKIYSLCVFLASSHSDNYCKIHTLHKPIWSIISWAKPLPARQKPSASFKSPKKENGPWQTTYKLFMVCPMKYEIKVICGISVYPTESIFFWKTHELSLISNIKMTCDKYFPRHPSSPRSKPTTPPGSPC